MLAYESLKGLSPTKQVLLDNLLLGNLIWGPLPGPQLQAYVSEADILYFGGAAGGGKSDLLLGLATTAHSKSIIFRREYAQLRELVDRSKVMLSGTPASFNSTTYQWSNIPGGRTLEFGATQYEKFKEKYKGRPHDFKGFDEVCDFPLSVFRFLCAWARTTDPEQRVRIVCAGNPPTQPEGYWVRSFWAPWLEKHHSNHAEPGELRWFAAIDGKDVERENGVPFEYKGELVLPQSRTFIPARLRDNPFLERTGYRAQLQSLPEPLRSQLLYGDFSLGLLAEDMWQLVQEGWVDESNTRWESQGPGDTLTSVGVDVARGGPDETVIAKRYGNWFAPLLTYPGSATPDGESVAELVVESIQENPETDINVDVIGYGASAFDAIKSRGLNVSDVNVSSKSFEADRSGKLGFRNLRAEGYWKLREGLEPDAPPEDWLQLPPDSLLAQDLEAQKWSLEVKGIRIEDKEQIKKRLGRSPNRGDAVMLAILDTSSGVFFG